MKIFSKIALLILLYFFLHSIFVGLTTLPAEGDSTYYHIPLARSILRGEFLNPDYKDNLHMYFPASSEAILSFFLLANIPLNLFNVLGVVFFFAANFFLSRTFGLSKYYGLLYATSATGVHGVLRWVHAQTVDIWIGAFYLTLLALLAKPRNNNKYFLAIGFLSGILVGSKYSAALYFLVLIAFFIRNYTKHLNFPRLALTLVPFSLFGLFWYIRNFILKGNPFYPQSFFFPGENISWLETLVGETVIKYPGSFFNAFLSEYMIWSLFILLSPLILIRIADKAGPLLNQAKMLIKLGLISTLVFLILPSGSSYQLHVSQFRFSYPAFFPIILSLFLLAKHYKLAKPLAVVALANLVVLPSLAYHPKLLFFFLPLSLIIFSPNFLAKLRRG